MHVWVWWGDSGRREGVGRRMCGCDSIIVA